MNSSRPAKMTIARALVACTFLLGGCTAAPDVVSMLSDAASSALKALVPDSAHEVSLPDVVSSNPGVPAHNAILVNGLSLTGESVSTMGQVLFASDEGSFTIIHTWVGYPHSWEEPQ